MDLGIELFVRGAALALAAALLLKAMRRTAASYRHLVCLVALIGLIALPVFRTLLPVAALLPAPATVPVVRPPAEISLAAPEPTATPVVDPPVDEAPSIPPPATRPLAPPRPAIDPLLVTWALGASLLLLRLAAALVRLRRLSTRSVADPGLGAGVRVSADIATPMTWGLLRPVIVLPAALAAGRSAACESALRHERAHIARRDWAWHLLAEIVCALCWFQPGAWWLRRRLRAESERACDDLVLRSGIPGPDYAAHLVEILRAHRPDALAPGMASVGPLEARVRHALAPVSSRPPSRFRGFVVAALGLALIPSAALRVGAKSEAARILEPAPSTQPSVATSEARLSNPAQATLSVPALSSLAQPFLPLQLATPTAVVAPQNPASPPAPAGGIAWGRVVDGLQAGIWITSPADRRVPLDTRISYRVLVRNAASTPVQITLRLLPYPDMDLPYLVPNTRYGGEPAEEFRALGQHSTALGLYPGYVVTVAPKNAVIVPGEFELTIGAADKARFPRVESVREPANWLVQPVLVRKVSRKEAALVKSMGVVQKFSVVAPDGGPRGEIEGHIIPAPQGPSLTASVRLTVVGVAADRFPLDKVVWGKAVDGLQTGIAFNTPRDPNRFGVPLGSAIPYRTLVRNATEQTKTFAVRLLQYEGYDLPTLVGDADEKIWSLGATRTYPLDPAYVMTLGPGESVIVPGQNGIDALELFTSPEKRGNHPGISRLTAGRYGLVQPVTVYPWPPRDPARAVDMMGIYSITRIDVHGRMRRETADRTEGQAGGTVLSATIHLDIGTPDAQAERNAKSAVWGKVDQGLQCGIRLLNPRPSYQIGDTLEAEVLWRNVGATPIHTPLPRKLDLYPTLRSANGGPAPLDFGARFDLFPMSTTLAPGDIRSLGTFQVKIVAAGTPSPESNAEPAHACLAPGVYELACFGGVGAPGGPSPESGRISFRLVGGPRKIAWGAPVDGFRHGITFGSPGYEVFVQNLGNRAAAAPFVAGALSQLDPAGRPVAIHASPIPVNDAQIEAPLAPGAMVCYRRLQIDSARDLPSGVYRIVWKRADGRASTGELTFRTQRLQ